jgi:hypothetical protein
MPSQVTTTPAVECIENHFQDKAAKWNALYNFKLAVAKASVKGSPPKIRRTGSSVFNAHTYNLAVMTERNVSELFEETQCRIGDRRTDTANRKSICPWKYEQNSRLDRFPNTINEVKCTCTSCNSLSEGRLASRYACMPVFEYKEVLVRTCGADGVFKWTAKQEPFSVGCTCSIVYNINQK